MEIRIVRDEVYTPEWNNNRKDRHPILVHIHYLTTEEYQSTFRTVDSKLKQDMKTYMLKMFPKIENLFVVEESGEKKEITNGAEIMETPRLNGLYVELLNYTNGMNTRLDSKN